MNLKISESFIVLDLDDTLYKERDYQLSGFRAVSEYCQSVYGKDILNLMLDWDGCGEPDIFGLVCSELGIPPVCKESFIWVYRNHFPSITLHSRAAQSIDKIQKVARGVAILTDGRSTTQRQKVNALGLSHLPVFISEEWNDSKPGSVRFQAIQQQIQAEEYWYIGDNPRKDFLAANELGWTSVGLKGDDRNIHSQDTSELSSNYLPNFWISGLHELLDMT